jgi:recombination protein RecA
MSHDSIESIVSALNKKFGNEMIIKGSKIKEPLSRITSGILAFDLMLGGGWPVNQWSEIIGNESSGKTALAYKTIAANQRLDPEYIALWVAAEEYVPEYAEAIGVDLDRLWVVENNVMEEVYDLVIRVLDNRAVDCIVIDSLPALVPGDEADKAMDEFTVGLGARLTGKFLRKSGKAQRRSLVHDDRPCTGFIINQWREKIGVLHGDPRTTPGGKAKNFHYFVRVEVARDEWITSGPEKVGQTIRAKTLKNKTYRPQQLALADFYFAPSNGFRFGDFDAGKDIALTCIALDVISRKGAYYEFNGEKWQGKEALFSRVREDLGLQADLREHALTNL